MSKTGSTITLVAGSVGILVVAYFATAAVKGASLREMPPMSWFSPPPPPKEPVESAPAPQVAAQPVAPVPAAPAHKPMTAGVLSAFAMPSPFDPDELRELETKLEERLAALAEESARQERRARELDDWQRALEERSSEIAALRESIAAPTGAASGATSAAAQPSAADSPQSWRALAPLFEEGDAADLAERLVDFAPEEAANILRGLEPERAAAILNALPKEKYKPFLDAWRKAGG